MAVGFGLTPALRDIRLAIVIDDRRGRRRRAARLARKAGKAFGLVSEIVVEIAIGLIAVGLVVATRALILEARAAFAEHAEIMVSKLEIIFRHHAIALCLGVTRERLVLLVKLVGVAAGAIVDPVAAICTTALTIRPGPAAAPPAATVLTIVYQRLAVLVLVVTVTTPRVGPGSKTLGPDILDCE